MPMRKNEREEEKPEYEWSYARMGERVRKSKRMSRELMKPRLRFVPGKILSKL